MACPATARCRSLWRTPSHRLRDRDAGEIVIDALPPHAIESAAQALCAGDALLGEDEARARDCYAEAYALFERASDRHGLRVAAARVVTAIAVEYGDLRTLDTWLARYDAADGATPPAEGTSNEPALLVGMFCVALIRGAYPVGVDVDRIVRRLRVLVEDPDAWATSDERMVAARLLLEHARIFRTPELAKSLVTATRTLADGSAASTLQRGRWHLAAASIHFNEGEHARADEHLATAQGLAATSTRLAFELGMARVDAALKRNDLDDAAQRLVDLESLARTASGAQRAEHARITARTMLLQDRLPEGLRWADEALDAATLAGYSGTHLRLFGIERAYALAANGRLHDALDVTRSLRDGVGGNQHEATTAIEEALTFLATGAHDTELLDRALGRAEAAGFVNILSRARGCLATCCLAALRSGTRTSFARRLIALHRLSPPSDAGPDWPWPVSVRTLGGFELEIASRPYRPARKAQDKPLELLKLLVAGQAMGRDGLDRGFITERLWPDADEPNARKSFDMALSRLRRLLQDDAAVVLVDGRLHLDPQRVWTDVAPLMRALSHAGEHRDHHARQGRPRHEAGADIRAVLELYRGPFLPGEDDTPWLLAGREAVAGVVRAALLIADTVLADSVDPALTVALERALAADPTSEDLARALMRLHLRAGRHAEAVRVYRRLREMLSILLGLAPSRETESLKADAYARAGITADPGAGSRAT